MHVLLGTAEGPLQAVGNVAGVAGEGMLCGGQQQCSHAGAVIEPSQ
jgi:hypothetical protein